MNFKKYFNDVGEPLYGKIVGHMVLALFAIIVFFSTIGTIGAGQRGVLLQFSAVTGRIFGEGFYVKAPFIQKLVVFDVRVQKEQTEADSASSDLQTVKSTIALNFHLNPALVAKIYQEVGANYKERLIDPSIQESVKASTAQFTAEQLITKREDVRETIKILLKEKLEGRGFIIDELNIVNFDFSPVFNQAIEAKVTAEQDALAAKNKLEQIKYEAQQVVEAAKGKAEAIQIEGQALLSSPNVVELRWIERWNGVTPLYWGGATPFIGINK